jgi:hypothetical protein
MPESGGSGLLRTAFCYARSGVLGAENGVFSGVFDIRDTALFNATNMQRVF